MSLAPEPSPARARRARVDLRSPLGLLLVIVAVYGALLVAPLAVLVVESLRPHEAGRIGGQATGWTLSNYLAFAHPQYGFYFWDTIRLSLINSVAALIIGYPLAYHLTRVASRGARRAWMIVLTMTLFLDALIRCYALFLIFGPISPLQSVFTGVLGVSQSVYLRGQIVIGLMSFSIPISVLALIGPLQNINPRLREAALTLGCSYFYSSICIDLRLAMPAVVATFFLTLTHALTAFTVPLVLGKGFVTFVSNVIYDRFSEIADYPGGAAFSILVLVFTLLIVSLATTITARTWRSA